MLKHVLALILALVMTLGLTACSKEEEFSVPNGDLVVARVYDTEITKHQLYVSLAAFVSDYDMTMADIIEEPALREKLLDDFLIDTLVDYALTADSGEYGYEYTEAEAAEFEEQYANFLEELDKMNLEDILEEGGSEDDFVEQRMELRAKYFELLGHTGESYKELQRVSFVGDKVEDIVLKQAVDISPETVRGYYDNLLKAGETVMARTYTFTAADPVITIYCEEGYRYVKPLLLEFPAASILTNARYYSDGDDENLQQSINRDVAYMQDTIDEIRAKLEAGADFDTLVEEYGQDSGMKQEPYKSRGYIAVAGSTSMIESYREACESLTDTEMVAECATYQGYWFLQASEIHGPGPMPFDEIKSVMTSELTAMEQNIQYSELANRIVEELGASGDLEMNVESFWEDL